MSMKKGNLKLASSSDGLLLDVLYILPEGEIKAIVELVHGMAEHKERYIDFMSFLAENGYGCIIHDNRGHGASVKCQDDLGYFYDDSAKYIVNDVYDVLKYIKDTFKDKPIYLFGHSMGSLIVRNFIQTHDDQIDKLIVCGSPSKNETAGLAVTLTKFLRATYGDHHRSQRINDLAFSSYNKEGEEANAWISYNPLNVKAYNASPLDGYIFTINGFMNLFQLLENTYLKRRYELKHKDLDILFVSGEDDPCLVTKAKFNEAVEFMRKVGYRNVSSKLYPNMRHEILNEVDHQIVYDDILAFIEK